MPRKLQLLLSLVLLAVSAFAGTGCGSGSSGTSIDPADAVPASAALYAGAIVRPEGKLQKAASTAGRTLTHQADPYLRLLGALQTPGSSAPDFEHDIAPWLGPHAGIFISSGSGSSEAATSRLLKLLEQGLLGSAPGGGSFPFAAHTVEGAILLDTRDTAKARSFLQTLASRARAHTSSYRGVSYQAANGIAFGIVSRLAVIGTEPALHAVIDTTAGGGLSLAHSPGYAKLQTAAPSSVLAHLYANPGAVSEGAGRAGAQGSASALSLLAGQRLLNVSLVPSTSSFAVDVDAAAPDAGTAPGGLFAASSAASRALGELPGESWLAVGLGDIGSTLGSNTQALQGLASLGSLITGSDGSEAPAAGLSVKGLLEGLLTPLRALASGGAETKRDFTSWMGSAGLFAAGTGLLELKGGVVIDSKDPALSRAAVDKLAARLRQDGGSAQRTSIPGADAAVAAHISGLPVVLDIADGHDAGGRAKFVIGIGEQSVEAALDPSSTLSGASSYGTAAATLGEGIQPSVLVEFPTLLGLLEGVGLSEDPSVSPFVPYLRSLGTLSGGGKDLGGGVERFRLVLGLQGSG
ncbi:MAG TPA: DUF3352 domain-containing protein [Solirubrobacteraceae bacterium]|jgi:hypothetical protein|nr:DUF3352 domain-containing protein [Solirubrobacteraceae bacterium]